METASTLVELYRGDALAFLPETRDLARLREAVQGCRGCDLYRDATQAVFGEGRRTARLLLVGEQPGDREDLSGHPFVAPPASSWTKPSSPRASTARLRT